MRYTKQVVRKDIYTRYKVDPKDTRKHLAKNKKITTFAELLNNFQKNNSCNIDDRLVNNISLEGYSNIGNCCVLSEFNLLSNFHSENKSFLVLLLGRLVAWHVSNSNIMFLKFPPVYLCQLIYSKKVTYLSHIKECSAQIEGLDLSSRNC